MLSCVLAKGPLVLPGTPADFSGKMIQAGCTILSHKLFPEMNSLEDERIGTEMPWEWGLFLRNDEGGEVAAYYSLHPHSGRPSFGHFLLLHPMFSLVGASWLFQ